MVSILYIFSLLFADPNFNPLESSGTSTKSEGLVNDGIHCCFDETAYDQNLNDSPQGMINGTLYNPNNNEGDQ